MKVRRTFGAPSQSPAVTAPPKGEPRRIPACIRNRTFLPLPAGEVAMPQGIDGEGETRDVRRPSPTFVLSVVMCSDIAVFSPLSHLR